MSELEFCKFCIVYDLREPGALDRAKRHRAFWGRTHTSVEALGDDLVVLVFTPSPDPRWRAWESVRKSWIERDEAA